jgi:hypothetical protein
MCLETPELLRFYYQPLIYVIMKAIKRKLPDEEYLHMIYVSIMQKIPGFLYK